MRLLVGVVVALVVLALAITVLGFIGPFVAVAGLLLALLVALNPGGVGARIRQSPGWWGFPGLRRASAGALPFAVALLLYTLPVPLAAFALVHSSHSTFTSGGPLSLSGVGGGPTATPGTAAPATAAPVTSIADPTPSDSPSPSPTPSPTPTPIPTAAPTSPPTPVPTATPEPTPPTTPTPHPNRLCGAPPNPWSYNFCGGGTITSPSPAFCNYFNCIKSFWKSTNGYVVECADGSYSHSGGVQGSCSKNGGDHRVLNPANGNPNVG